MKVSFIADIVVSKIVHSFYCQVVLRSNSNLDDKGIDNILFHCIHVERAGQGGGALFCPECLQDAAERLSAVSSGSVAISVNENISQRGQAAIYRCANGTIKSETWKYYGRGEAECALSLLVAANDHDPGFVAHPLLVAQDPNFFWPLIDAHRCVRAALEYVAPHVDWNKWNKRLGPVKDPLEQLPICQATGTHTVGPGKYLRRCGNDFCNNLEPDKSRGRFLTCFGCQRRSYCSDECCRVDFKGAHKRECRGASGKRSTAQPEPDEGAR